MKKAEVVERITSEKGRDPTIRGLHDPDQNHDGTRCTDGHRHFCETCGLPAAKSTDVSPAECRYVGTKCLTCGSNIDLNQWWIWSDGTPRELFGKAREIHGKA